MNDNYSMKGLLRRGDSSIAVKKIKDIHVSDDQFLKEATLIMGIQHPNVVRFLGYCSESKRELTALNGQYVFAEKQARMLCFEYLCKGSLDKYLSGTFRKHETENTLTAPFFIF